MEKLKALIFLVLFCLAAMTFASVFDHDEDSFFFSSYLQNTLPGGFFYTTFLENYAPDTTFLIEENNGFAFLDNPKVYFEGDSYIQFNWYLDDFRINSNLDEGSPAFSLPFSSSRGFLLQGESPLSVSNGFHFLTREPEQSHSTLMLSSVYSDLGGYSPWASFFTTNPASERDDHLYSERRKILSNFFVDSGFCKNFGKSSLMVAFNYYDIHRQFNDFNEFNQTFEESLKALTLYSRYQKKMNQGLMEIVAVANYQSRGNLDAELGRYPQETFEKEKYSFFGGFRLQKKAFNIMMSFLNEHENLDSATPDFFKDLKDNDGEGFLSFGKMGVFSANALNIEMDVPLKLSFISENLEMKPYFDFSYTALSGDEQTHSHNAIFYDGQPYLVFLWEPGNSYDHSNLASNMGISLSMEISRDISLTAKLWLNHSSLSFDSEANNLSFWTPAFDAGLILFKNKNPRIFIAYGRIPYDLRENVNMFLETGRPSASIYYWEDLNHDLNYQAGEEGPVYGYSGGQFHYLDENISRPCKNRFLLDISTRLSRNWNLNIKGIYKKITDNFWVRFDREYGFFDSREGYDLYFYDRPFQHYILGNQDFDDDPFYAQLLLNLQGGVKGRWFFSFSFMAHIGMGTTAFGNGAGTNDIGVIDESQADPNSWINGYGRLDGDRAFVGKVFFGFYILKNLFAGISLKYRDGNPFAFISSDYDNGQWVFYYRTIKAEDSRGVKGGPREDYLSDISIQFNYQFQLFNKDACLNLAFFNILDVGYELSEYVFSGGSRDAMELAIPRSLRLGIVIHL